MLLLPHVAAMPLVLDDFSRGASAARWTCFTDQVMGGVSKATMTLTTVQGQAALRLHGAVSLERNGGFIQMARSFAVVDGTAFDASGYRGLVLTVCGEPGMYYVHLRTADTRAPWQYYGMPLPVTRTWTDVALPWGRFSPVSLRTPLSVTRLIRLGVVAAQAAFEADIAVARVALAP